MLGADPGLRAAAAPDEEPISPAVARIVTVDTAVRAEPSHGATAVASLEAGDEVSVSAQVPAWRKVTVGGVEGWVPYSATEDVPTTLAKKGPRELVADQTLRAQPGPKATALVSVLKHSYVSVTAVAGSWRKIETPNGTGWVPASVLESATTRGYTATRDINVRGSASGATAIVLVLKKGQKLKVLGTRGEWSSVRVGSYGAPAASTSGWTATKNLVRSDIRVTKTALNLRTRAWTGKVVTVIPKGARVTLTGSLVSDSSRTPTTWRRVTYGSYSGWVASKYLKLPY
jgi:uncharacterized protein YgiM (DUF1202 family)